MKFTDLVCFALDVERILTDDSINKDCTLIKLDEKNPFGTINLRQVTAYIKSVNGCYDGLNKRLICKRRRWRRCKHVVL